MITILDKSKIQEVRFNGGWGGNVSIDSIVVDIYGQEEVNDLRERLGRALGDLIDTKQELRRLYTVQGEYEARIQDLEGKLKKRRRRRHRTHDEDD